MQSGIRELLERRRNRAIAIVLGVKERECDMSLSAAASQKMRKVILDQMNDFCDLACDVLESLSADSGVVLNEHYLEKIDEIHASLTGD